MVFQLRPPSPSGEDKNKKQEQNHQIAKAIASGEISLACPPFTAKDAARVEAEAKDASLALREREHVELLHRRNAECCQQQEDQKTIADALRAGGCVLPEKRAKSKSEKILNKPEKKPNLLGGRRRNHPHQARLEAAVAELGGLELARPVDILLELQEGDMGTFEKDNTLNCLFYRNAKGERRNLTENAVKSWLAREKAMASIEKQELLLRHAEEMKRRSVA